MHDFSSSIFLCLWCLVPTFKETQTYFCVCEKFHDVMVSWWKFQANEQKFILNTELWAMCKIDSDEYLFYPKNRKDSFFLLCVEKNVYVQHNKKEVDCFSPQYILNKNLLHDFSSSIFLCLWCLVSTFKETQTYFCAVSYTHLTLPTIYPV